MQYIGVRSCNCLPENDSGYMGSSKILNEAMKVEPETFTKIIIDTFPTREIANANEQWLHETYDVARNPLFYNQINAPFGFCNAGKHHSKEAKEKMRKFQQGKTFSPEARKRMSEARMGKTLSPETRKRMSEAGKGRTFTPEHRKNISAANKGRTHSPAHKKKLSEPRGPQKKIQCPHCSKIGGKGIMQRWHFNNCREIS